MFNAQPTGTVISRRKRWRKEAGEIKEEKEVEERSRRNKGGERGGGKKQEK